MTPSSLVAPPQAPPVPRASIESQSAHIHTNPDCAMTPTPTPSTTPSLPLPSLALPLPLPLPPVTASRAKADTSPASPLCKHSLSLSTPWQQSFENTPAARLFQDKQDDVPDQSIAWSQAALQPCTPPPPLSSSSSPPSPSPSSPSTPFTSAATNISPLLLPWSPISPPCGGGGGGVQLSQISQISTDNRNDKSVDCMAPRICEKVDPVLSTPDRISTLQHLYPLLLKQQEPSQYYPSQQQQPQVVQFRGRGRGIGRGGGHEEPELQLQKELHEEEEHSPKQLRVLLSQPPPLQQSQQQQSQQEQQRPSHSDSIHSNDSNMHCSPQVSRSAAGYLSFLSKKKRASRPYPQPTIVSDSTSSSEATPSVQTTTTSQLALSTSSPSSISGPREGCDETLEPTRLGLVSVVGGSPRQSLSRSHRGSISSPTLSALGLGDSATESQPQPQSATIIATTQQRRDRVITTKKSSAKALLSRAVGFGNQTVSETPRRGAVVADTDTESSEFNHDHKHGDNNNNNNNNNNSVIKKPGIGSYVANEVLSLIFRNLMDRKSILNCSLVSRHWHGPAEAELVRIIQDMPFNGQGLVHAIRTRFAADSFPCISMSIFDKLVSNLSELYYHSNPETQQIFAPEHPPDMLYHLFWTFLFIDQEFRNPRARPKVTCNYFVRLLQNEGGGYPRQYFDKKVLKNIYHDIRSRPLLPAPHLIRALQEVDTPGLTNNNNNININNSNNNDGAASYQQQQGVTGPAPHQRRSSSFLNLAHSIKLEDSFKRVRRWWGNSREESGRNQVVWVSHLDSSSTAATSSPPLLLSTTTTTDNVLQDPSESAEHLSESATDLSPRQLIHSSSSTFPASSVPAATSSSSQLRTLRSRFGTKSELAMNKRAMEVSRGVAGIGSNSNSNSSSSTTTTSSSSSALYITSPIMVMDRGFTAVAHGWHAEGDGLDNVVRFPKPRGPSTLGSQYHILQCSELMLEMDLES